MKDYFIILPSSILKRIDIDATTKFILGYIDTRLNIPEVEWTISSRDVADQLGLELRTTKRHLNKLVELKVLIKLKNMERLEIYKIDRNVFSTIFDMPSDNVSVQTDKMSDASVKKTVPYRNKIVEAKNIIQNIDPGAKLNIRDKNVDTHDFSFLDDIKTEEQKRISNEMDYRNAQKNRFNDKKSPLDEFYNLGLDKDE